MEEVREKIKEICELESRLYTIKLHNETNCKRSDYYRYSDNSVLEQAIESSVSRPEEPRRVSEYTIPIPHYDPKKYMEKARKEVSWPRGDEAVKSIAIATAVCCMSVIGIAFFWAPLTFWLIGTPFAIAITRRRARKMYIEECMEIEERNRRGAIEYKKYQQDMVTYRTELARYEHHQITLDNKKKCMQYLTGKIDERERRMRQELDSGYAALSIPKEYRNILAVLMLQKYLTEDATIDLPTVIKTLQKGIEAGSVTLDIQKAKQYKHLLESSMRGAMLRLDICEVERKNIFDELVSIVQRTSNFEEAYSATQRSQCLSKYC